jgi:hypothetical protein
MQNGHRSGNPCKNICQTSRPEALSIARGGGNNNRYEFSRRKKQQPAGSPEVGWRLRDGVKRSGGTGDRVAGRQLALISGQLRQLAAAHFQQPVGVLKVVIVMAYSKEVLPISFISGSST